LGGREKQRWGNGGARRERWFYGRRTSSREALLEAPGKKRILSARADFLGKERWSSERKIPLNDEPKKKPGGAISPGRKEVIFGRGKQAREKPISRWTRGKRRSGEA